MAFNITGIQYLFLVGGFAESPLLQMEIRKEFNSMLKVIIPQDVGLSILKGNAHIIHMVFKYLVIKRFVAGLDKWVITITKLCSDSSASAKNTLYTSIHVHNNGIMGSTIQLV